MPPIDKHLHHLSQILSDRVPNQSSQELTQAILNKFFQSVASERIRIDRLDWRGHALRTLLWHWPSLRPAGQAALSAHIVDRWVVYSTDASVLPIEKGTFYEKDSLPVAVENPFRDRPLPETGNPMISPTATRQNHFFAAATTPHRDWFDRFTDWVAAVVSLWE